VWRDRPPGATADVNPAFASVEALARAPRGQVALAGWMQDPPDAKARSCACSRPGEASRGCGACAVPGEDDPIPPFAGLLLVGLLVRRWARTPVPH
jgi:MYXO-CTERM domain-containing protein